MIDESKGVDIAFSSSRSYFGNTAVSFNLFIVHDASVEISLILGINNVLEKLVLLFYGF